jgi:hypothetical protein
LPLSAIAERSSSLQSSATGQGSLHRPVVCVTDLSIARDLLTRDDGSLGQSEWSFDRLIPDGYLEYMEGAAHDR